MSMLNIPERYRPGLSLLATMADDSYSGLLGSLRSAPPSFSGQREVTAWVMPSVKSVSEGDINRIFESLASLSRVLARRGAQSTQLAHDVSVAALDTIKGLTATAAATLERRLDDLLPLSSLIASANKAKELQVQRERTLCDVRLLTDLRPVFADDVTKPAMAMTVIHTLKIGYHDSNSSIHKEFYVALDAADIKSLKSALERAEQKEQSLKDTLETAHIRLVELT